MFVPFYDTFTPYSVDGMNKLKKHNGRGRKTLMNASLCLRLAPCWYRTRGSMSILCMIFGIKQTACGLFIRFVRKVWVKALSKSDRARVCMPTAAEIRLYNHIISGNYSLMDTVYAFADGLDTY